MDFSRVKHIDIAEGNVKSIAVNGTEIWKASHRSHNQWNEQWELGEYIDGEKSAASSRIRSKNYIAVTPNASYYVCFPSSYIGWFVLTEYDENKNFIKSRKPNVRTVITVSEETHYITFNTSDNYGKTYNNDISINYPSTFTDYEPY